jgi:hypothetical protein
VLASLVHLAACDAVAGGLFPSAPAFPDSTPRGPEESCTKACASRAAQCSQEDCSRGCNSVIDRLVEKEGGNVIACVANAGPRCDDRIWAGCATRVGPHADGGPPAPPPPEAPF